MSQTPGIPRTHAFFSTPVQRVQTERISSRGKAVKVVVPCCSWKMFVRAAHLMLQWSSTDTIRYYLEYSVLYFARAVQIRPGTDKDAVESGTPDTWCRTSATSNAHGRCDRTRSSREHLHLGPAAWRGSSGTGPGRWCFYSFRQKRFFVCVCGRPGGSSRRDRVSGKIANGIWGFNRIDPEGEKVLFKKWPHSNKHDCLEDWSRKETYFPQ